MYLTPQTFTLFLIPIRGVLYVHEGSNTVYINIRKKTTFVLGNRRRSNGDWSGPQLPQEHKSIFIRYFPSITT